MLVAIAGAPASGKSTLAAALARRLAAEGHGAMHVPMDGFHLDNAVLAARGLLSVKGAPETFDAGGFVAAMHRLARERDVVLPDFDRARDIAIAGRVVIGPEVRVAVVEGNYLTFDADPWRALQPLWQFSVFLAVPEPVLRARLIRRWTDHGLDPEAARIRAEANDLANAARVMAARCPVSLTLHAPQEG